MYLLVASILAKHIIWTRSSYIEDSVEQELLRSTAGWKTIVEGESALFHEIVVPSDEEGDFMYYN